MDVNVNTESHKFHWSGIYRAKVINSQDPNKQGRIKIWIPDLMPEVSDQYGIWAYPANNYVGGRNSVEGNDDSLYQGSCLIPPTGSYVYIFFEVGNVQEPRYLASLEIGQSSVPIENQQGDEYEKKWTIFKSRQGRTIIISDDPHDERIEITGKKRQLNGDNPDGNASSVYAVEGNQSTILIDERDGQEKILIKDHNGNYITINTTENKIDVESTGELNIKAATTIKITADAQLDIKSTADINIQGSNVNIKADANLNMESGADANLKGGANTNIEATAAANIKAGAAAAIQGGAAVDIKGGGVISIAGSSLSIQAGAGAAGSAGSATSATDANPDGDRNDPSTTEANIAIIPKTPNEPPETIRYTEEPPKDTQSK